MTRAEKEHNKSQNIDRDKQNINDLSQESLRNNERKM